MTMQPAGRITEALQAKLESLEKHLETPVVPGEQFAWLRAADTALMEVGLALRTQIARAHPQQFAEIETEDAELIRRVEQLQAEDREITESFRELQTEVEQLAQQADRIAPDEGPLENKVSRFADRALALVIQVRKQEQAIDTWTHEAFNRDRGVAD